MEIKIDTKRDSVSDIKKAIDFLLKFVEETRTEDLPTMDGGAFNMFGGASNSSEEKEKEKEEPSVSIIEY